jgi:hypothetical protein
MGTLQQTLCCVYVLCCLRLVFPMLPISLACPCLIAPSIFSNVYLIRVYHEIVESQKLMCEKTGSTGGTGTALSSGAPMFTPCF